MWGTIGGIRRREGEGKDGGGGTQTAGNWKDGRVWVRTAGDSKQTVSDM